MDAVIYLRDVLYDGQCDCEKNVEIDEARSKMWFIGGSMRSPEYDLYAATPLISPTSSSAYTLYQLIVFAKHYLADRDWADYILEAKLIDERVVIDERDCDFLHSFLSGATNSLSHSDPGATVPAPKQLAISKVDRKRKSPDDGDYFNDGGEHSAKRPRTMKHEPQSIGHGETAGNHSSSLFTENYAVPQQDSAAAKADNVPFWKTLPLPTPSEEANRGPPEDIDWQNEWRQQVRESATRNSVLNSPTGKSFQNVARNFQKISRSLLKLMASGNAAKAKPAFIASAQEKTRRSRTERAIIVVPESNKSLLTLSNAVDFLEKGRYVAPNSMAASSSHQPPGSKEKGFAVLRRRSEVDRRATAKKAEFEIRGSSSFSRSTPQSEWDRVAAIFVIGRGWQFKQWAPGWREPEVIFNKTAGFHLHFSDHLPTGDVKHWRVNHLAIGRSTRHGDAKVSNDFWKQFIVHLRSKHKNKKIYF